MAQVRPQKPFKSALKILGKIMLDKSGTNIIITISTFITHLDHLISDRDLSFWNESSAMVVQSEYGGIWSEHNKTQY